MALVFQLFSEPPQNVLLEPPQKMVMFDEPMVRHIIVLSRIGIIISH
jgi:hypothetical protein